MVVMLVELVYENDKAMKTCCTSCFIILIYKKKAEYTSGSNFCYFYQII